MALCDHWSRDVSRFLLSERVYRPRGVTPGRAQACSPEISDNTSSSHFHLPESRFEDDVERCVSPNWKSPRSPG